MSSSTRVKLPIGSTSAGTSSKSNVCAYYAKGMCRFGECCRFAHIDPPADDAADDHEAHPVAGTSTAAGPPINPDDPQSWVLAPVFVPKQRIDTEKLSYAEVCRDPNMMEEEEFAAAEAPLVVTQPELCPYVKINDEFGMCAYGDACVYAHGDLCDLCGQFCLHPTDEEQRKNHNVQCIRQHEKDMELSFAIARSKDKLCGICFEVIMEKSGRDQRFGILPNCNHIFCLECIRKWRQAKQFDNKIIRSCPECRVASDFVCPSTYWVDTQEEKLKLIEEYKAALNAKDCKYYKKGSGSCPFGNKCFYKHADRDGKLVDLGAPRRRFVQSGTHPNELEILQQLIFWDFIEAYEVDSNLSDSDDSDWSEYLYNIQ
ncbi:E3 ubiquitin-protein ligase makorin-1 [Lutzomyia longipalpis]|uniref:E3 ubiquitin-protein ligase makorin-1 n=1 Tax=Lutzomyia longipalpis TaxID=7200 RepID=UPI00248391A5|nr:E3 ubiquitin-protein ligase makorin-1 [Lutzomyia longipalpis]XP_055693051.1 E3 ubiquitin-protein ligase makorin-1 [Lutzomyia longipalpis]XP_055693052.1 E3 ubiquitin-protein ligase makorin-1 [Lutzomyia longipalpis]